MFFQDFFTDLYMDEKSHLTKKMMGKRETGEKLQRIVQFMDIFTSFFFFLDVRFPQDKFFLKIRKKINHIYKRQ